MKQEVLEIFKSKDAPFLITVAGLVVLYGIKRVTETNYQFTASTKDGERVVLSPNGNSVKSDNQDKEIREEEGGEA